MVFIHIIIILTTCSGLLTVLNEFKDFILRLISMQTKYFFPFVIDIGNLVTKVPLLIHQISVICTRVQHSKHQRWFSKWPENLTLSINDQSTDQVTL